MEQKINTVIFDMGEVYLKGMKSFEVTLAPILKIDLNVIKKELHNDDLVLFFRGDISEREYWSRMIEKNGWDITVDRIESIIRKHFVQIEGTREIVEELRRQGYKLGLLSVHTKEWVEYIEKTFDYRKLFDSLQYSYEVKALKPEKKVYRKILEDLKSTGPESLFIDDKEENLIPARELGLKTILFTDSKKLKSELASFGIKV